MLIEISKAKKRTFRGVFLNISKSKYAFTFEHSIYGYEASNRKRVPFTEKNLREMGRHIIEAFSKFVISGLKNYSIYFSDYNKKQYSGKPKEVEAMKKKDHADFVQRLSDFMDGKETVVPQLEDIIMSMNKFQEDAGEEIYSEGGSDSEFSDEDMVGAEKKVLLKGMADYSKAYVKGMQSENFSKSIRKDFQRVGKKSQNRIIQRISR